MRRNARLVVLQAIAIALSPLLPSLRAEDLRPKHITPETIVSVRKGLDYLAQKQDADGGFQSSQGGAEYPTAMTALAGMAFLANGCTPSRGPYADQVRKCINFLVAQQDKTGLIARGPENGRPMYGHGFSLMFLSCVHGMEQDPKNRERIGQIIKNAIQLTASGQSNLGGWYYTPGSYDEGSVTVTQMQALRAAHNAGFTIPKGTIEGAIKYLELCKSPEGGIIYSYRSGGDTRTPITAAAVCCLYSTGDYDSPLAETCLKYVQKEFKNTQNEFSSGHYFYLHLYASQAFYQAGDEYWDAYFPAARDNLLKQQAQDGSWSGDGVGQVYGTALACMLLQLPYKYLPIYQR
jgi:prenyltransferase beta subunit